MRDKARMAQPIPFPNRETPEGGVTLPQNVEAEAATVPEALS